MKKDLIIFSASKLHHKANLFLVEELKKNNIHGLGPSHGDILGALFISGQLQLKELIDIISKNKSTITALVQKLIKFDYVEKIQDPEDGRVNYIRLTEKGELLKPTFIDISKKLRAKAFKGITDEEREKLSKILTKICNNF